MRHIQSEVHIQEDDLHLYTQGRLEPERISLAESHLAGCQNCRQLLGELLGHRLALHPPPALRAANLSEPSVEQKRTEPRFTTEGEATVQELHPISFDRQPVKIVNVSKNGLGIVGAKAILPGTIVQLRMNGTVELGNVRYCSALDSGGFRIGLRLSGEG
jgi:hypothetical protein